MVGPPCVRLVQLIARPRDSCGQGWLLAVADGNSVVVVTM